MSEIGAIRKAAPLGAAFLLLLAGCAAPERFGGSRQAVVAWSQPRGFAESTVNAGKFQLLSLARGGGSEVVTIYIEGDGASWPSAYVPPGDPTPDMPLALALAAADPSPAVVYLGRPCQYLDHTLLKSCDSAYWTARRFSPEVIAAFDDALRQIKHTVGARRIRLVGHSGGGVIAALLAARRDDVDLLVTVAAPLALGDWVAWHDVSPLRGSLDPMSLGENVLLPRSVHFVGGDDRIVPATLVERFARRKGGRVEIVADFGHECCWARDWAARLARVTGQEDAR